MNNHAPTNSNLIHSLAGNVLVAGVAHYRGVGQLADHRPHKPTVACSSHAPATIYCRVAQLVEHQILILVVAGSGPAPVAIFNTIPSCPLSRFAGAFFFLVMGLLAGLLITARIFLEIFLGSYFPAIARRCVLVRIPISRDL